MRRKEKPLELVLSGVGEWITPTPQHLAWSFRVLGLGLSVRKCPCLG
jgi:hypothetical protein